MSDAPVAAKGWWEGMKPVNFQWTVLRCDIQVAQELNRGGGKGHSGPTSGPITNFQAARKRHCPQNARRGGVLVQNKEGQNPPGDRCPCHNLLGAHRIASIASRPRLLRRHYRRAFIDRAFRPSSLFIVGAHCQRAKAGESVTFPPADRPEIRPAT